MKYIFRIILVWIGISFFPASAQNYSDLCVEKAAKANFHCMLRPVAFTAWTYNSGYGSWVGSVEEAAENTYNWWYTPPGDICQGSYKIEPGGETKWDGFVQSNQSIEIVYKMPVTYGLLAAGGGCQDVKLRATFTIYGRRSASCNGYTENYFGDILSKACMASVEKTPIPVSLNSENACHGNPLFAPLQEKVEVGVDLSDDGAMPLEFRRIYRSHRARDKGFWFAQDIINVHPGDLGAGWFHNYEMNLSYTKVRSDVNRDGAFDQVRIQMEDGSFNYFDRRAGGGYIPRQKLHELSATPDGYVFSDGVNEVQYHFNADGGLVQKRLRNGWSYKFSYNSDKKLASVRNEFGQFLSFSYNAVGKLISVSRSDGRIIRFEYDSEALSIVRQADDSVIRYVYDDANSGGLLSGVVDEMGVQYATFGYDYGGRARITERAGGVARYVVNTTKLVSGTITTSVTDPLQTTRQFQHTYLNSDLKFDYASGAPAKSSMPVSAKVYYDGLGLPYAKWDWKSNRTDIFWNTDRQLPVIYSEGVNSSTDRRDAAIDWHHRWRLPVTVTEPGRVTTYAYDALGNVLSQTVTATGVSGGSAPPRITSWTYHPSGLVATETAANGAVTSYQYDSAGNLTSTTNALGHVDTYTHDGAGRVLTHTAATGLVTTYTYDARGRVLTIKAGGLLSTFTYRPTGQVATASPPHGHVVTYTYDAAQRLTGWSDNRGNSGTYTLDAMGNRTQEDIRNAQGQTVWRLARSINSLNRVASVTLGGQVTTHYGYDDNGDWIASTNGLNQSTRQSLDALRRTQSITNAESATASLTYNALDAVTQATDFKGVTTTYTRDALGNATTETSPDSGAETAQYDALGLPKTITDALGQATTIERDLLGRPTLITHADGRTTTLRYDLTATSKGYLGEIVDASGTTTYERDPLGRVTAKTQRLINGDTRSVSYSYNAQGLLASTTYPGGQALQYVYDTTGQLTGLTWVGQPVVSGITWNPLGQPTGWSWNLPGGGTAIPATRSYNTAGQLTATEFSSYQYDAAGRINGITQNLWQPASTNPQDATITEAPASWTVQYSPAGRITGFTRTTAANGTDTATFQYDPNGNRKSSTREVAGTTTSRTYSGEASHNRLLGFSQTTSPGGNSASTSVTYQYNSAGDLLSDGLTRYHYDSEGRLDSATTGQGPDVPTTKYAHNALGQRVFKTEPLFSSAATPGTGKNLNNLLADDGEEGEQEPPGLIQQFLNFWSKLWSPSTSDAEKLGWSYVYAEDGSLLGEYGSGGSASSGTSQYLYLPTASGPMPIAAVIKGQTYAIHSDHLNTPRKLTQADGQAAWQWAYSAFGEEQPTTGAKRFTSETTTPTTGATSIPEVMFNLRYPGQYFDSETKLHYNHFRSYDGRTGRYTQGDPIGLDGGWNRFAYVGGNPLSYIDALGLCPCGDPAAVAKKAQSYEGSSNWRYDIEKGRFSKNTNKCNLFVEDVLKESGSNVPDMNGWFTYNGPTAGQWGDPKIHIPGYPVVEGPLPGDIVAIPHRYGDATGHVGIVVAKGSTASQSSVTDLVEVNSWGFRPGQKPVFRRCTCPAK